MTAPNCQHCNETMELTGNHPLVQGYQLRDYQCPKCAATTRQAAHWDHSLTEPHGPIYHE